MTRYISLAEYLVVTELAMGFAAEDLIATWRIDLADSALHAPQAGHGDQDFYPDIYDKAAMLAVASGEIDESTFADWLRERVTFNQEDSPGLARA